MNTIYKFLFVWIVFLFFSHHAKATIYYADVLNGADTNNGLYQTFISGLDGPMQSIVACINASSPGDTVMVTAGVYVEEIDLNKPITLLGNNHNISAKGIRNAETILYPVNVNINAPSGSGNAMLSISENQVTLKGFFFDGDNPKLTSGNTVGVADIDIDYGVVALSAFDDISIANNKFANINRTGIFLQGGTGSLTVGDTIDHCSFKNFRYGSTGISCTEDFVSNITNCSFELVDEAIYIGDFTSKGTPHIMNISHNDISCQVMGIRFYKLAVQDILFSVFQNKITSDVPGVADAGLLIESCSESTDIKSDQNYLHDTRTGVQVSEHFAKPYNSTEDTIKDVGIGIFINNASMGSPLTVINYSKLVIDSAGSNAIELNSDVNNLQFNITNSSIHNSTSGIVATGKTELSVQNSSFTKSMIDYIQLGTNLNGDAPTKEIEASNNMFDGVIGSNLTTAQAMIVEDKMFHVLDNESLGFVNFKPKWLHVTNNTGNSSLNRAVKIANDNWSIVVDTLSNSESVSVDKDITVFAPDLRIGTLSMDMTGKILRLFGNVSLKDGLDLNGGNIDAENANLTVGEEGIAKASNGIRGGSDTSFVKGVLNIVNINSARDTLTFPIGRGGDYRPVTLDIAFKSAGDTAMFSGQMFHADRSADPVDSTLTHVSTFRYWNFAHSGGGTVDAVYYTLSYDVDSTDDMVSNPIHLRTAVFDGTEWQNRGGSGTASGKGTATSWFKTDIIGDVTIANAINGSNFLGYNRAISNFNFSETCFGDATLFRENALSNGGNVIQWAWDFGDTTSTDTSSLMNPSYVYSGPGTYKAKLTVMNDSGGINTISMDVKITPLPDASFTEVIPCFPLPIELSNTSTISQGSIDEIRWTVDTFMYFTKNAFPTLPDTGTYNIKLVVVSDNGCKDSTSKSVYYGDSVKITFDKVGPVSKCDYDTIDIGVNRKYTSLMWSTGDTGPRITVSTGGYYTLTATTSKHCSETDSIQVIDVPRPFVDAGIDLQVERGDEVQLQGSGDGILLWTPSTYLDDPGLAQARGIPMETIQYTLTATDAIGCTNSDSMIVEVVVIELIRVNNMITPNNDGKNDIWDLTNIPGIDDAVVVVMSRWGQEVFRSENYQHDWDGTYQGKPLPEGTYIYILDVKGSAPKMYKGNLELIR